MAASAARDVRIEDFLGALQAYVDDFPALAEEWDSLVEADQAGTLLQWDHLMADYLTELDEHYRAGEMSEAQAARFRCLVDQLRSILPLIRRLQFSPPPVTIVSPASLTERVDGELAAVEEMVTELAGIDRDWDEMPESFLVAWLLDWDQAMGTLLREVGRAKEGGKLSPDQVARYCSLLADLKRALPVIIRRNLYRPPVPLDS